MQYNEEHTGQNSWKRKCCCFLLLSRSLVRDEVDSTVMEVIAGEELFLLLLLLLDGGPHVQRQVEHCKPQRLERLTREQRGGRRRKVFPAARRDIPRNQGNSLTPSSSSSSNNFFLPPRARMTLNKFLIIIGGP